MGLGAERLEHWRTVEVKLLRNSLALLMLIPGTAMAATDGAVGTTSSPSADISLTIPNYITVKNVASTGDYAFGTYNYSGNLSATHNWCVGTSQNPSSFTIEASGTGAGAAFTISNGTDTIPYSVNFHSASAGGGTTTGLTAATPSASLTVGTHKSIGACVAAASANVNASLTVSIQQTDIEATSTTGNYTGTLTLLFTAT